jgi:hypothetical protein
MLPPRVHSAQRRSLVAPNGASRAACACRCLPEGRQGRRAPPRGRSRHSHGRERRLRSRMPHLPTRCGMAVVQKLANVRSAAAHPFKPRVGEPSQPVIRLGEPSVDAGVSVRGAREPRELAHQTKGNFGLIRQRSLLREVCNAYLPRNSMNSITVPSGSSQQNTFIQPPPKYTRAGGL